MRTLITFIFLPLMVTVSLYAQDGKLTGRITDFDTKEPLIGATILANPGMTNKTETIAVMTDTAGNYSISLAPGIYFVDYTYVGYVKMKKRIVIEAGVETVMDTELEVELTTVGLVTVTGGKYEKKFGEESVSMEVLPPSIIANNNITTLDKAVDKVPGVSMIGETMNIRGGAGYSANAGSRVIALIDDIPWLTPQNSGIAFWAAPLENVKQVEIIKGASSTLYGSSAVNGTMNIITENAKDDKPYSKVNLYTGLYENPFKGDKQKYYWSDDRLRMMYGFAYVHRRRIKKFDFAVNGAYNRDESYLLGDEKDRVRFNFKTRFRPKDNLTVGLNGNMAYQYGGFFFIWSEWKDTPQGDSTLYVPKETEMLKELPINIDPYLTYYDKKGNKHSIKGRYYYIKTRNSGDENTDGGVVYGEYSFHSHLKPFALDFITGVAGSLTSIDSEIFDKRTASNAAVFLQIDKKFFEKLTITAGFRGELFRLDTLDIEMQPIGRCGFNYQVAKASYFRGSIGMGYRYPSIAEKFVKTIRAGVYVVPNVNVQPERSWNAEAGFKQAFNISKWYGYIDVAGFITRYYNMMEFTRAPDSLKYFYFPDAGTLPAFWSDNVRDARISGFEFSALGQGKIFGITTNFLIGYTFISPIDLNYDPTLDEYVGIESDVLIFRFKHTAKCDIQCAYKGLSVGISAFINSFMENIDFRTAVFADVGEYRKAHEEPTYAFDARVGYDFSEKTRVTFIAKNVTNNDYAVRPGIIEAPRNYTLQLAYEF